MSIINGEWTDIYVIRDRNDGFVETREIAGALHEAEVYFGTKFFNEPWMDATQERKLAALRESTLIMMRLSCPPLYLEDGITLANWPAIPRDLRYGCYENAYGLLNGINPDDNYKRLSTLSRAGAGTKTEYRPDVFPEYIRAGVTTASAWSLIRPYILDDRSFRISRNS